MDTSNGVNTPDYDWFWTPKNSEQQDSSEDEKDEGSDESEYDSDSEPSDDSDDNRIDRAIKRRLKRREQQEIEPKIADTTTNESEFSTEKQIEMLLNYLRTKYFYCLWCGVQYKDNDDLNGNCPGIMKDDH